VGALYEREPQGGPQCEDGSNPDEDPPDWDAESRSYHLFFLPLADERFQFETDTLEPGEDGVEQRFSGEGRIGFAVGISLIAPFALSHSNRRKSSKADRVRNRTFSRTSST